MSIWEKLADATADLVSGSPIAAVLGDVNGQEAGKDQLTFTFGVIALGAKMAKADGVVTRDEVNALKEVFKIPAGGRRRRSSYSEVKRAIRRHKSA